MDTVRRHRQGAVDCRSKRMDQIRPFWCVHPQCARAARAEMALSGAGPAAAILFQLGAVDAEPFATPDLQARAVGHQIDGIAAARSEEHTSELQSLMRISYAVFCLKKKTNQT